MKKSIAFGIFFSGVWEGFRVVVEIPKDRVYTIRKGHTLLKSCFMAENPFYMFFVKNEHRSGSV